jgi:hypothetical protein
LQSLCQHHLFFCPSCNLGDEHVSILLLAHCCSILEEWLKQSFAMTSIPIHCMMEVKQMDHKV